MATYTVTIDERTNEGRGILAAMKQASSVVFRKPCKCGLDEALEDVKAGRVTECDSVDEYFKKHGVNI